MTLKVDAAVSVIFDRSAIYYLINLELKANGKGNLWIDDLEYKILEK